MLTLWVLWVAHILGSLQVNGGVFVRWRRPPSRMPRPQSRGVKRKEVQWQVRGDVEDDASPPGLHMRATQERRSKVREDRKGVSAAGRGKRQSREHSPPPKKRNAIRVESEAEEDKDNSSEEGREGADFMEQSWR